jgi:hypothetical protein
MDAAVRRIENALRRDGYSCQGDREYIEKRWIQLSGG